MLSITNSLKALSADFLHNRYFSGEAKKNADRVAAYIYPVVRQHARERWTHYEIWIPHRKQILIQAQFDPWCTSFPQLKDATGPRNILHQEGISSTPLTEIRITTAQCNRIVESAKPTGKGVWDVTADKIVAQLFQTCTPDGHVLDWRGGPML